jgi:hypothetical protein
MSQKPLGGQSPVVSVKLRKEPQVLHCSKEEGRGLLFYVGNPIKDVDRVYFPQPEPGLFSASQDLHG